METRKIQRVSNGTYTVSLPREWAEDQGLSAGAVVDLHTHIDGLLVVQTADEREAARIDLTISDETATQLARILRAAYTTGALEIHIEADGEFTGEQRTALRSVTRAMAGVTVADESESHVEIRNVLNSEEVSVRQSVRHLQFVALSRHREATAALLGDGPASTVADSDNRGDRLHGMVERYFVRSLSRLDEVDSLGESRPELFQFYEMAAELAHVATHADRIASAAADVDEPIGADLAAEIDAVATQARDAVETAVDATFAPDPDAVWSVFEARDDVRATAESIDRRLFEAADADYRTTNAVERIRRTADCAGRIATVGLRSAIREGHTSDDVRVGVDSDEGSDSRVASGADE